ncbi:MAG: hypothetical protein J6Y20_01185 [Lachnospiraceae bacterium]|nr:hypothetical protein [Lachnospiraceae bacterium]
MPRSDYVAVWERQTGESTQAYKAFTTYRDMGEDRSIRAVAERLDKSTTLIGRWSVRWNWVERVRQYDNTLQREAQAKAYKKAVKELEEMQLRQIKTAVLLQKKAVQALDALDPLLIKPQDIVRMISAGAQLENVTRSKSADVRTEVVYEMEIEDMRDVEKEIYGND